MANVTGSQEPEVKTGGFSGRQRGALREKPGQEASAAFTFLLLPSITVSDGARSVRAMVAVAGSRPLLYGEGARWPSPQLAHPGFPQEGYWAIS